MVTSSEGTHPHYQETKGKQVMTGITEKRIEEGKKATLKSILEDLNNGHYTALYFTSEDQICTLIEQGKVSEDVWPTWVSYSEDMRIMMNDAIAEFSK